MGTGLNGKTKPPLPLVRVRSSRGTMADDHGAAGSSTPSLRTPVTVPFLWEDAPGRPKPHGGTVVPADATAVGTDVCDHDNRDAKARHLMQLKLPPRLQVLPSAGDHDDEKPHLLMPLKLPPRLQTPSSTVADHSLSSPKTVLQGPYYGSARKPPRSTTLRRVASLRRMPSAGAGGGGLLFFSRRKATSNKGGREHDDASCRSPSPSSTSSAFFFGDGTCRWPADGRVGPEEGEDEGGKGLVRITRFRRNRSLPSMTTAQLWASIRKSVKQIAPWS